jgi:F-type H+-transporting ATPase subunit b
MDSLLNINPGLAIWTLVNFLLFLFIFVKFAGKGIIKGLNSREDHINSQIRSAEKANEEARSLLEDSNKKLDEAQQQVSEIVAKGRLQADAHIKKAAEEAESVKRDKVIEAQKEIERSKEAALKELRNEVADLVVLATEKIIEEKLDKNKDLKLVESYIEKIPKN